MSRLRLIDPGASREEAAAIMAAIEHFMRATASDSHRGPAPSAGDGWCRAALLEGVSRDPQTAAPEPWLPLPG